MWRDWNMHSWWMSRMLATGVLCALIAVVAWTPLGYNQQRRQRSLPCDHPLRIVAPSLFSHCGAICGYSDWTAWETVQQRIPTTNNLCASRRYYVQQRTRQIVSVIGDRADCNEVNQTQKICKFLLCSYRKGCIVTSKFLTCKHAPNIIVSNPSIACNIQSLSYKFLLNYLIIL